MENVRFEKKFKGHDVYVNDVWIMWVIGSKRNAKKEIEKYLNNQ